MAHLGVIATSYPRDEDDFAGRCVRREAQEWAALGHEVTVVTPRSDRDTERPRDRNIRVVEARTPKRGLFYGEGAPEQLERSPLRSAARVPAAMWALGRSTWSALRGCDALIAHWLLPSGILGALAASQRPFGVVAHSGGVHMALRLPRPLRAGVARALQRATWVRASSPPLQGALSTLLRRPVEWSGPVAETGALTTIAPKARGDVLTLGFLGRRVPVKGLDLLLDAHARSQAEGARVRLIVAGPGARLPSSADVEDRGVLAGRDDMRRFFTDIDALIVPSREVENGRTEGLPCVIQEAYAAARPVIAADVGGIAALVPAPWRFAPGQPQALQVLISTLVREQATAELGVRCRARWSSLTEDWRRQRALQVDALLRAARSR